MLRVPAGSFIMGSPESEDGHRVWEQQRQVTFVNDFYLGKAPVTQSQYVAVTGTNLDPTDLEHAQELATDEVFESLMRRYCALPRGAGPGKVSGQPQWHVATFNEDGKAKLSGCAASSCDVHPCVVSRGFITAALRSDCASAPASPPPVGQTRVGTNYVIRTIADGDPMDYTAAHQIVTDAIFQS